MRAVAGILLALAFARCGDAPVLVSEAPIPVTLDGSLYAYGSVNGGTPYRLLIDTGTPLSSVGRPVGTAPELLSSLAFRVLDAHRVPRVQFPQTSLLATPLGPIGAHDPAAPGGPAVEGVLGGDLLQQFSVLLRYSDSAGPSVSLLPPAIGCSCALADSCEAVLNFTLAGGGTFKLRDDIYTYPATRVTVDACLTPVVDPQSRGQCCDDGKDLPLGFTAEGAPGTDVRLLVSSGFSGMLLGASAYDRVCDAQRRYLGRTCPGGSAAALLAAAPAQVIDFPDPEQRVGRAARVMLGDGSSQSGVVPLAALALVGREGLLSACGELARSRRLRAHPPEVSDCDSPTVPLAMSLTCLQQLKSGGNDICQSPDRCNDRDQPAAAYIELDDPIAVWVVDDTARVLREVSFDVRPQLSDVEGIVGTDVLARLEARIDYANHRVIAHCASSAGAGCATYPRYACPSGQAQTDDCDPDQKALCNPPSSLRPGGPACQPAPRGAVPMRPGDLGCAPVDLAHAAIDSASVD